jgi:hypothetical protein
MSYKTISVFQLVPLVITGSQNMCYNNKPPTINLQTDINIKSVQ